MIAKKEFIRFIGWRKNYGFNLKTKSWASSLQAPWSRSCSSGYDPFWQFRALRHRKPCNDDYVSNFVIFSPVWGGSIM